MGQITEKSYLNKSLRTRLISRLKLVGNLYDLADETISEAVSALEKKDEYFCNLIKYPFFNRSEIEKIIEINI